MRKFAEFYNIRTVWQRSQPIRFRLQEKSSGIDPYDTIGSMRNEMNKPTAERRPLAGRVASGAVWIAIEIGATQATSLLIFAVMARFLTPSEFGIVSISYLVIFSIK